MKMVLLEYANFKSNDEAHWNLCLETVTDVKEYFEAVHTLSAHNFWEIWCDVKKGYDLNHASNSKTQGTAYVAMMEVMAKAGKTPGGISVVKACGIHDKMIVDKFLNFLKIIENGEKIRCSSLGGYCKLDGFFNILEEQEIDTVQLKSYLTSGKKPSFEFKLDSETVVIENQSIWSDELYRFIDSNSYNKPQLVNNFKYITEGWKKSDFIKLFDDSVKNKTKTIIAETTLYDEAQFSMLAQVLIYVMNTNPDKTLNVKILFKADKELAKKLIPELPSNLKLELL